MLIDDPWFYVLAIPALILTGIAKGGFPAGGGNLGVPMMSQSIPAAMAAGITLPILITMDVIGVWAYRRDWDRRQMRMLLPGAMIGIVLGTLSFRLLSDAAVKIIVGAIAVGFVAWTLIRPRLVSAAAAGPSLKRGTFWSALSGFTSTVAHAGGPPLAVYLLPQRLDRRVLTATTVVYFFVVNLVKVPPYLWNGQFSGPVALTALALLPCAPVGMLIGIRLNGVLSDKVFYRVIYTVLTLSGLKLLWDGITGIG